MGKFFIALGIIGFLALMLWCAWLIYTRIAAGRILRESRNKKSFTFNYLYVRFSRSNVINDVKLLIRNKEGQFLADMGLVFVNRGGVILIETVQGSGYIDITEGGPWNRISNNKFYTFADPFILCKNREKAMKSFLRHNGMDNIPVHSLVLFSGKRVKFSKKLRSLITAEELAPYLADINKDRFLSGKEIKQVVKLFRQRGE